MYCYMVHGVEESVSESHMWPLTKAYNLGCHQHAIHSQLSDMPSFPVSWYSLFSFAPEETMHLKSLFVTAYLLRLICASALRPRAVGCNFSTPANNGDTCESFCKSWGLDVAELKFLGPGIQFPSLVVGQKFCVVGDVSTGQTSRPNPPPRSGQPQPNRHRHWQFRRLHTPLCSLVWSPTVTSFISCHRVASAVVSRPNLAWGRLSFMLGTLPSTPVGHLFSPYEANSVMVSKVA